MSTNQPENKPTPDWRELRDQERAERHAQRRAYRGGNAWIAGVILVLLGVLLMFQNTGVFTFRNWWALFILIPAIGSLATAWRMYTASGGQFNPGILGPLAGGLVLLVVTAVFLFDLNWALVGPVLLILVGVGALLGAFARSQ